MGGALPTWNETTMPAPKKRNTRPQGVVPEVKCALPLCDFMKMHAQGLRIFVTVEPFEKFGVDENEPRRMTFSPPGRPLNLSVTGRDGC